MSRLVLYVGARFGRFAVLLFALPLFCPIVLWFWFLDRHPLAVIAAGVVAIPAAMLAIVLLIGTLFAGFGPSKVDGITRESAPKLWAVWESIAGKHASHLSRLPILQEYAQKAWDAPDNESADHPPWSEHLTALGFSSAPEIEPVLVSALSSLLSDEIVAERVRHFDGEWTSNIADALER
ncbi:hypothetical protein [Mesorhizobium sp. M0408]|uniref:hypothetical protein n=1 Tax=Mesorhizobium sp. M0408 TaxID=2956942 RepID=UPI00333CAAA7